MARKEKISKEELLNGGVEFIRNNGIENLNVRNLAKYMGCSTQPMFRHYKGIDDYKKELKVALHRDYEIFISKYIDEEDYLLTISYAYALYAKYESNIFRALFITELAGTRTVTEVINSSWNRPTIAAMTKRYNLSLDKAEQLYRDTRFYTHGIACQLCSGSIKLESIELYELIKNLIEKIK